MPTHEHRLSNGTRLRLSEASRAWVQGHDVQFYDSETSLSNSVARFLVDGVRAGQPLIVIATKPHRKLFEDRMRAMGVQLDDLVANRDVTWLDAEETLAAFMEGDRPDPELFEATVGNVFATLIQNRRYVMIRAYGEMVDILWKRGKSDAALALEGLWNDLAEQYAFSLLCAYSKDSLAADQRSDGVERICQMHSRVLPADLGLAAT